MKLKYFRVEWKAEIYGHDIIEALDEQDAEEQFDPYIQEDRIPQDQQIQAEIDWVSPCLKDGTVKKVKKK